MPDREEKPLRRPWFWLIRFIGLTVPGRMRAGWRSEWEAELRFREMRLSEWDKLNFRARLELLSSSLGAFSDALWLQSYRWEDQNMQDFRYTFRMLAKNRAFTLVAVLTLALGIGANVAMFSVLNTYFLRPLPYPDSDRLLRVFRTSPLSQSWPHSPGSFYDEHDRNTVFQYLAAYDWVNPSLAEPGQPAERLHGLSVTSEFFPALAVQPALGRVFTAEEDQPGHDSVVVISNRFWLTRFRGDPSVVGQTLRLDGTRVTIIGVMPSGYEYPLLWGPIDLWRPLAFSIEQRNSHGNNYLQIFGRLKPGISLSRAQSAMTALASSVTRANLLNSTESWRVEPLRRSMADDIARTAQWFTFGLACIVLLIACANIANLQLVRVAGRSREYAIRSALGAGRRRLLRQSLAESLIISLIGGSFSVLLAYWGIEFINRRLFRDLPGARVTLDLTVLAFTLAVSMLTGLIFGMVPAWLASCVDVNQTLRDNARGSTAGRTQHRLRHSLIAGEVAFALVLLAGAGLFLRGLQRYARLDPGWRVDGLVTANVMLQGSSYETDAQRRTRYEQIEERLSMLPGVRSAAISQSQPVWGFSSSGGRAVEGQPEPESGRAPEVFSESVSLGYFETMGIPLIEGRTFTAADTPDHPPVVIINQAMARRFWPNESAIGKRIGNTGTERNWEEIVGIAGDVGFPGTLDKPYTGFQSFRPLAQAPWGGWRTIELRTARPPEALAGDLKQAIASLDSDLPVYGIRTARSLVEQGLGPFSLVSQLLGTFALLGFALAAIGIYGVTSYSVAQRTAEIGVRMALGARRRDVLWLVLAGGARLVLVGTILGLAGAYAVGRLLESAIPTLPTHDPFTLVFLTLALIAVALFACYLPARRATRVDPLVALRSE